MTGGQLEEALEHYKRCKEHGIERAAMHIRNVCIENCLIDSPNFVELFIQVSAKILGQRMKQMQSEAESQENQKLS